MQDSETWLMAAEFMALFGEGAAERAFRRCEVHLKAKEVDAAFDWKRVLSAIMAIQIAEKAFPTTRN